MWLILASIRLTILLSFLASGHTTDVESIVLSSFGNVPKLRPCPQGCLYAGVLYGGLQGNNLLTNLQCSINSCLCRTDLWSSATHFLSGCITDNEVGCDMATGDANAAISDYSVYCSAYSDQLARGAGGPVSIPAVTTIASSLEALSLSDFAPATQLRQCARQCLYAGGLFFAYQSNDLAVRLQCSANSCICRDDLWNSATSWLSVCITDVEVGCAYGTPDAAAAVSAYDGYCSDYSKRAGITAPRSQPAVSMTAATTISTITQGKGPVLDFYLHTSGFTIPSFPRPLMSY
jgi:hypothetical protein